MRQVSVSFPTQTQTEVCATNATAASGTTLVLNGNLSQQIQGTVDLSQRFVSLNGYAQPVSVFSTGNISTSTFAFTGLDINGYAIATSFAGPTGTAIPTKSTSEFAVVFTASVGATLASSPFTIGFGPSGTTRPLVVDNFAVPVNVSFALVRAATSGPVTFQHTYDNVFTSTAPTWSTVTFSTGVTLASLTVATSITVTESPFAVRALLLATAAATGVIQTNFSQPGV